MTGVYGNERHLRLGRYYSQYFSQMWTGQRSRYIDSLWMVRALNLGGRGGGRGGFPQLPGHALGTTQTPALRVPGLFPRGKATRPWRWSATATSTKVKEWVQLHIYSTSGPSWPVVGWPLPIFTSFALHKVTQALNSPKYWCQSKPKGLQCVRVNQWEGNPSKM